MDAGDDNDGVPLFLDASFIYHWERLSKFDSNWSTTYLVGGAVPCIDSSEYAACSGAWAGAGQVSVPTSPFLQLTIFDLLSFLAPDPMCQIPIDALGSNSDRSLKWD